jgi:hypothetical protein
MSSATLKSRRLFFARRIGYRTPQLILIGLLLLVLQAGAFGRFTGTVGDFSNFGTAQANVQANVRVEF